MKKQLVSICIILALLFAVGGFTALFQGIDIIWQSICAFLPIFKPVINQAFKDYLSSAQFIVAVIIFVLSSAGIYVTVRFKKFLLMSLSIVLDFVSMVSIISNLAMCK